MNLFTPRANEIESITLREYIDARFEALKESTRLAHEAEVERAAAYKVQTELIATAIDRRFAAVDRSTELAAAAVEKRLESMNEFRAQLNTQASSFVTRTEIEDKIAAGRITQETYERRIQAIEQNKANADKVESMRLFFEDKLESQRIALLASIEKNQTDIIALREYRSQTTGKSTGATQLWGYIVGATGILIALVSIALAILKP